MLIGQRKICKLTIRAYSRTNHVTKYRKQPFLHPKAWPAMSTVECCCITALFGIFLETNKHQNLIWEPRPPIFEVQVLHFVCWLLWCHQLYSIISSINVINIINEFSIIQYCRYLYVACIFALFIYRVKNFGHFKSMNYITYLINGKQFVWNLGSENYSGQVFY